MEPVQIVQSNSSFVEQFTQSSRNLDQLEEKIQDLFELELEDQAQINLKNCSSLKNAKVILLGECHTIPKHRRLEIISLLLFAKEGTTVFLEGADTEKESRITDLYYPGLPEVIKNHREKLFPKMRVIGWDEKENLRNHIKIIRERRETNKVPPPENKSRFKGAVEALKLKKRFQQAIDEEVATNEREQCLIAKIMEVLNHSSEKKIIVIAGSYHLQRPRPMGPDHNILEKLPNDLKCASIIFNRTGEGMTSSMTDEEYTKELLSKEF